MMPILFGNIQYAYFQRVLENHEMGAHNELGWVHARYTKVCMYLRKFKKIIEKIFHKNFRKTLAAVSCLT